MTTETTAQNRRWKSAFAANSETLGQLFQLSQLYSSTDGDAINVVVSSQHIEISNTDRICTPSKDLSPEVEWIPNSTIKNDCENHAISEEGYDDDDDNDDDIQVLHTTVTNPNVIYPHVRYLCGIHTFNMNDYEQNQKFCPKCYCYVCDVIAVHCKHWIGEHGHCNAYSHDIGDDNKEQQALEDDHEIIIIDDSDSVQTNSCSMENEEDSNGFDEDNILMGSMDEEFATPVRLAQTAQVFSSVSMTNRKHMRIHEIFSSNIKSLKISVVDDASVYGNIEGDIPHLNLQPSFYVEGVRIGWPYLKINVPQRQMALHLIKAFKSSKHVAIESPTGKTLEL